MYEYKKRNFLFFSTAEHELPTCSFGHRKLLQICVLFWPNMFCDFGLRMLSTLHFHFWFSERLFSLKVWVHSCCWHNLQYSSWWQIQFAIIIGVLPSIKGYGMGMPTKCKFRYLFKQSCSEKTWQITIVNNISAILLSQPNSTWTRVGSDKVIGWPYPQNLLRHFQATQEADFRCATLLWPN